ncbi:MAG: FAD-dependent oxidoreductase [Chloroflexi bacterium]|nr:FAD-dependent oxidoreductase [Chloroflexota bacterium]
MSQIKSLRTVRIPACTLPVVAEADVIVVGGGNAGFIAAIAAARSGARTILVERYGYLGGCLTGTYAAEPGFFGDSDGNLIIRGIGWEFIERMEKAAAAVVDRKWWLVQIFPEAVKAVALDMVVEAGVELYLYSWASDVLVEKGVIQGLIVQNKSGRQVIAGKVFVDATGDADLAFLAGAPTEKVAPDQLWQTSVDLTLCNVDVAKVVQWAKENPQRIGFKNIPKDVASPGIHPMLTLVIRGAGTEVDEKGWRITHVGPMPTVKLMIHPSISRVQGSVEIDGTDVQGLTYAEIEARRRAMAHLAYLQQNVPGFEHAIVVGESHLGVRETRRIIGDYVLTIEDLRRNARFPDVVALNCRALDRHIKGEVFQYELLQGNHDIPLRALIPQQVQNLLVAGRCISSDHEANASLRGAATCLATGHAAGTAAALAALGNGRTRDVDIATLQRTLKEQGAILSTKSS